MRYIKTIKKLKIGSMNFNSNNNSNINKCLFIVSFIFTIFDYYYYNCLKTSQHKSR